MWCDLNCQMALMLLKCQITVIQDSSEKETGTKP